MGSAGSGGLIPSERGPSSCGGKICWRVVTRGSDGIGFLVPDEMSTGAVSINFKTEKGRFEKGVRRKRSGEQTNVDH